MTVNTMNDHEFDSQRRSYGATPSDRPRPSDGYAFGLLRRAGMTVRTAAEVLRFGGLDTGEQPSPFTVVAEQPNYRLRRYFADQEPVRGRPVVLIPPLMLSSEIWDVSPNTSAVLRLHADGLDPWVVDFGDPGREPGGSERTLTDHVLAVSDAVDRVHAATSRDLVLAGYSQGGMFAYQAAAYRRCQHIDSLITFGSPADTTAPLPIPVSPEAAARMASGVVQSGLLRHIAVPSRIVRFGFDLLSPVQTVRGRVQFLLSLHDRESLLPRERQRRFLEQGWTGYPGPALAELLEQFVMHNRMLEGGFVIDDRLVTLADITVPVLTVVGTNDVLGHPDSVRGIRRAAPRADVYELTLHAGHFGLVVGSKASQNTWPAVTDWARWRDGQADLPDNIGPAKLVESEPTRSDSTMAALAQATDLGLDTARIVLKTTRRAARLTRNVLADAPTVFSRLARIERLDPSTRISLGLLLSEQAAERPEDVCFLFEDRAYRQREVKHRVDSVVKALISVGVRHGDRVGLLMGTRPSAFAAIAALSRIGATAVLLRPDGELPREAELGGITRVICDPDHANRFGRLATVPWCVLGGGPNRPELPPGPVDLERIDLRTVTSPAWYRADPQRAADIAFVLFTGEGATTRAVQITNRRWATSALGTATAAALTSGNTVYSLTPHYHSSALLMSYGGALAGGARFAMASATDPDTFWSEVRRYGTTHVTYTWTSLRKIVHAPPNPAERHHPIRMFMGSGLPPNLWRRITERFPTTRVLEFYASAESQTILANLTGSPVGSLGRPLPGTPEVRIAAIDRTTLELEVGRDGLARQCASGETGLLLTRVERGGPLPGTPLRGVFEPDDAWHSTGDLFRRDQHGQLWLIDSAAAMVHTVDGPVAPAIARRALTTIPTVDLCVAYPVPDGGSPVIVAAVTLLPGAELTTDDLDSAMGRVPADHRPSYLHVVPSIPVTTWHRPLWRPLQQNGIPTPTTNHQVWRLIEDTGRYQRQ